MKPIRFFWVPAALSASAALLHSLVTTIYVRPVSSPDQPSVVIGIEAIERLIRVNGVASYVLALTPFFVLACLSCWGSLLASRGRWRWWVSVATAMIAAVLYRLFLQVTFVPNSASGDDKVVSGVAGLVRAVEVFGIASVGLQLLGCALLFLLPILLTRLFLERHRVA
jgi:hypothetical protein